MQRFEATSFKRRSRRLEDGEYSRGSQASGVSHLDDAMDFAAAAALRGGSARRQPSGLTEPLVCESRRAIHRSQGQEHGSRGKGTRNGNCKM
mmetsp:Transcript_42522/g.127534  ORF Transcript_42522/g.127534 Transcript_42522/m.127534 type:complete len:92 (+) Transcript_42522:306-581(+)